MKPYEMIRSGRRTLALEVTRDCRVVVRAPWGVPEAAIRRFVERHEAWIDRQMERQRLRAAQIPLAPTKEEIAALKDRAWQVLPEKVAYYSEKMGMKPTGIKITTARTRYGSCSGKNSLCFSCFLMNCPEEAIDLVVVHELCHIRVKNHGPQFYALLAQVLPDYQQRREGLK